MSTDTETPIQNKSILEFKSTSFSVPVLVIFSAELKLIDLQLDEKIAQAPEFFKHSALLIDLKAVNHQDLAIDIIALINCLQEKKLLPIGICGGNEEQNRLALELNIPIHTLRGTNTNKNSLLQQPANEPEPEPVNETALNTIENMLISQPIRSGQRIYAKGDLTIVSHVSAGAEIMAEGNIHIYGALRGRALAGVQGNTESRIFCSDLDAELVSIAGHYKISEELNTAESRKPTQIYLQEQALIIKNF